MQSWSSMTKRKKVSVAAVSICLTLAMVPATALAASMAQGSASGSVSGSAAGSAMGSAAAPGEGGSAMGSAPGSGMPGGAGGSGMGQGGGGANTMTYDYTGTYTGALTVDGEDKTSDGETYTATDSDENAVTVQNAGSLAMTNGTLSKSGDDTNGDNCNFYGLNSIVLSAGEKSIAYVSKTTLDADSEGSNGIFATDSGTVYAYDDTITTSAGNSRGLDSTYGGTIVADSMDITTQGDHCAGVANDRGGGYNSVTNSTIETNGSGSPVVYSTGVDELYKVTGTAKGSQIAGMEGLNTILIYDSQLSSENDAISGSDPIENGVIIYQSMSGDAEATSGEAATFDAVDSTLKTSITSGSMFYLTNTSANVVLQNTKLDFDSSKVNLLYVEGNDSNNWGSAGSNGATVNFTGIDQELSGNINVDTISSLDLYLLQGSTWTGAATIDTNSTNTDAKDTNLTVNVDGTSTWVVTADTTVNALNVADGGQVVDSDGKTVSIVADGKTVVEGTSDITVTVTGTYSTDVTTSSVNEITAASIDRTAFDTYFGTTTTFGTDSSSASSSAASTSGSASGSASSADASGSASGSASSADASGSVSGSASSATTKKTTVTSNTGGVKSGTTSTTKTTTTSSKS